MVTGQQTPHQLDHDHQAHARPEPEPGDVAQVPLIDGLQRGLIEARAEQEERAGHAGQHQSAHCDRRGGRDDPGARVQGGAGQRGQQQPGDHAEREAQQVRQPPGRAREPHRHQHGSGHEPEEQGAHGLRMRLDEAGDGPGDGEHGRGHADQQRDHQDPVDGAEVLGHPTASVGAGEQASHRGGEVVAGVDELVVDPGDQCDGAAAHSRDGLDHAYQRTAQQVTERIAVLGQRRAGAGLRRGLH